SSCGSSSNRSTESAQRNAYTFGGSYSRTSPSLYASASDTSKPNRIDAPGRGSASTVAGNHWLISAGSVTARHTLAGACRRIRSNRSTGLPSATRIVAIGVFTVVLSVVRHGVEVAFEGVQAACPHRPVRREPRVDLGERLGTQPVQPALRVAPDLDQPHLAEHPQVFRHGRLGERQPL